MNNSEFWLVHLPLTLQGLCVISMLCVMCYSVVFHNYSNKVLVLVDRLYFSNWIFGAIVIIGLVIRASTL